LSNLQLFIAAVAIWGSTWLAITFQLGKVAPEASVFYRFLLASLLVFAYCFARRLPLRYTSRQHLWVALMGVLMFSVSYILVYYAEQHVVSGLVAVGYSASPMLGLIGMRVFFGTPMTRLLLMGSILGMVGIALVFWPEFAKLQGDRDTALGAMYTITAVVVSALGSIVAQRNSRAGQPLWQSLAWGMLYGAAFSLAYTLATGQPLAFEATMPYVLSLIYLAVLGSILASAFRPKVQDLLHGNVPGSLLAKIEDSLGSALGVARDNPSAKPFAGRIVDAAQHSFVTGMHAAVLVAAAIAFIGAIGVLVWLPARARTHPDDIDLVAHDPEQAIAEVVAPG